MKKILAFLLFFMTACAAAAPQEHSQGPPLQQAATDRLANAFADRGPVTEIYHVPGVVRIESQPLFFGVTGFYFYAFHVQPGDHFEEGQILAQLNTRQLQEEITQQQAYATRLHRIHTLENEVLALDIDIRELEYTALRQTAAITLAESDIQAAQNMYLAIESLRLQYEQQHHRQRFEAQTAAINLRELEESLTQTTLTAPFSGVVTQLGNFHYGIFVSAFDYILYAAPHQQEAFIEFTGDTLPRLPPTLGVPGMAGNHPTFAIVASTNGHLMQVEYKPMTREEAAYNNMHGLPRRVRFTITCDNALTPGTFVWIKLYMLNIEETLRLPTNALFRADNEWYVYRLENQQWLHTPVEVGAISTAFAEIIYGVSEGDELRVN